MELNRSRTFSSVRFRKIQFSFVQGVLNASGIIGIYCETYRKVLINVFLGEGGGVSGSSKMEPAPTA